MNNSEQTIEETIKDNRELPDKNYVPVNDIIDKLGISQKMFYGRISESQNKSLLAYVNKVWCVQSETAQKLLEQDKQAKQKKYITLETAVKKFGPVYHDSNPNCTDFQLKRWIAEGRLDDVVLKPNPIMTYLKEEFIKRYENQKRFRLEEAFKILNMRRKMFYLRIDYPEEHPLKIRLLQFPSGTHYITEEELQRQQNLQKQDSYSVEQVNKITGLNLKNSQIRLEMNINGRKLHWFKKNKEFRAVKTSLKLFLMPQYEKKYSYDNFEMERLLASEKDLLDESTIYDDDALDEIITARKKPDKDETKNKIKNSIMKIAYRHFLWKKIDEDLAALKTK